MTEFNRHIATPRLTGFSRPHSRRAIRVRQTKLRSYLEGCLTHPGR